MEHVTKNSLLTTALDELNSDKCVCGAKKRQRESFCRGCFYALPGDTRRRLYRDIWHGYSEIYAAAKQWLRDNTTRLAGRPA